MAGWAALCFLVMEAQLLEQLAAAALPEPQAATAATEARCWSTGTSSAVRAVVVAVAPARKQGLAVLAAILLAAVVAARLRPARLTPVQVVTVATVSCAW